MRNFILTLAVASMLGLAAAQAAQPANKSHQAGAEAHRQPTAHRILADADGAGADVRANPNFHNGSTRRS
jgi:hypothetical protein